MTTGNEELKLFMVPARNKDLETIKRILAEANLPCGDITIESLADFCVALSDGEAVGMAGMEMLGAYALLRSVAVDKPYRGRGVGRKLVEERLEWAARFPIKGVYLLTLDAADYFSKFGFKAVARAEVPEPVKATTEFSKCCPDSATVMLRAQ